jgi:hypothetical protein
MMMMLLEVAVGAAEGEFGLLGGDLLGPGEVELRCQVGELGLALVCEAVSLLRLFDCGGELAEEPEVLVAKDANVGALISIGGVLGGRGLKLELDVACEVALPLEHFSEAFEINGAGLCSMLSLLPRVFVVKGEPLNEFVVCFDALNPLWRKLGWKDSDSIESVEGDVQFIKLESRAIAFGANVCELFFHSIDLAIGAGNEVGSVEAAGDDAGRVSAPNTAVIEGGELVGKRHRHEFVTKES